MLYNDDCFNIFPKIEDKSIDLTITSPPYDNLRTYNNSLVWNESIWKGVIKELYRVTKDGGVVVWIVGDATIKGSETGTSFKQALYAMECGFRLHDTMIWNKGSFTAVGALKVRYSPVFEYMFIWSKGGPKSFNPIKDRPNIHFGKKYHGTIRQTNGSTKPISNIGKLYNNLGQRFNIWNASPVMSNTTRKNFPHPAPFPEQIVSDHIISWSNEGDLVFDPFMGSGTTGAACKNLNRSFIGIEKEKEYFDISVKRINDA